MVRVGQIVRRQLLECVFICSHASTNIPAPQFHQQRNSRAPSSKLEQKRIIFFLSLPFQVSATKSLFLSGPGTDPPAPANLQIFLIDLSV